MGQPDTDQHLTECDTLRILSNGENLMNTRAKRFVAAVTVLEQRGTDHASATLKAARPTWDIRWVNHPIDGHPMAAARQAFRDSFIAWNKVLVQNVTLVLSGVRHGPTTGDIEISAGLDLMYDQSLDLWSPVRDTTHTGSRLYSPPEIAQAQRGTADTRLKWKTLGTGVTAPDVKGFRVIPVPGRIDSQILFFDKEIPVNVAEGTSPIRDEVCLSGRTTSFGTGAKMVIGIPWMHRDREILFEIDIQHIHTVVSELKTLLTPAPAPSE